MIAAALLLRAFAQEKRAREIAIETARTYGESPPDQTALGKLSTPTKWAVICLLLGAFQCYSELAIRKDLRRSLPALAAVLGSSSLEIATFSASMKDGETRRLASSTPVSLFEKSAGIVLAQKRVVAWPIAPNQPHLIAVWDPDGSGWQTVTTSGNIPEFRHNPDMIAAGSHIVMWGGSRQPIESADLSQAPVSNGYALDLVTRTWVRLPAVPEEGLLRSRIFKWKNEIILVTLSYEGDKKLTGVIKTYSLASKFLSWKPKQKVNLKDFTAVELYGDDGKIIVLGILGEQGGSIARSLDTIAKMVLDAFELRSFEDQIKGSQQQGSRFLVFDLDLGLTDDQGRFQKAEAPSLLTSSTIVGTMPGVLALRDENSGLILCRFDPFECHLPLNAEGKFLMAYGTGNFGGRLIGQNAIFWNQDSKILFHYNFASRSLQELDLNQIPHGSRPYAVLPTGDALYGLSNFETSAWEGDASKRLAAIACPMSPLPERMTLCSQASENP